MPDGIKAAVLDQAELMGRVNDFIYAHPELGLEEHQCADYLTGVFETLGLAVERPVAGMETAFKATLEGRDKGPRVGMVLLYDAVPAVDEDGAYRPNHSCGHNVISGAVTGAVAALAASSPRGQVVVMGLPGDEIGAPKVCQAGGGKALTAAAGEWDGFDAVFYAHPEFLNAVSHVSRWMDRYRLQLRELRRFPQRGELPGSVPWAVQALLEAVRSIEETDTQEFVMIKDLRIDGDVEGECYINAQMQVLLYGLTEEDVAGRAARLEQAVGIVSEESGIPIDLRRVGARTMGVNPNHALTSLVQEAMTETGLEVSYDPPPLPFATDFGNISHRAPSALIGTGREGGWRFHTVEGAREFGGEDAHQVMMATAEILARSTASLWSNPDTVDRIRAEFDRKPIEGGQA